MVKVTNPFDGDISDRAITSWLDQFEPEERPIIIKLLEAFRYYSSKRVNGLLRTLHATIQDFLKIPIERIWFVPVGYVAKSGAAVAYFYRKENRIPLTRFIAASDLVSLNLTNDMAVVFLDDLICSGDQATLFWRTALEPIFSSNLPCPMVFGALVGFGKGIKRLKANTEFKILTSDIISEEDLPLSQNSTIFDSEEERKKAYTILEKYGKLLYPEHPLGYSASQGLLGFFYSTPNNTFPIFWATEGGWHPLLPHGESFRDPKRLIGPPIGLAQGIATETPRRVIIESTELHKYDIPPDMAIKIFSEFRSVPVFLVLAPIVRSLKLSEATFSSLLRIIGELKFAVHEQKAICSSILMLSDKDAQDLLGDMFVEAAPGITLENVPEVLSLARLVDGFEGAVIIKTNGEIIGDCLFNSKSENIDFFLPERYHKAATASLRSGGLLLLFEGNGRVSIFLRGNRVLSHRGASWHLQAGDIKRGVEALSQEKSIDPAVLKEIIRMAYRISDDGLGALIAVGDHRHVLDISDPPRTKYLNWIPMRLGQSSDEVIVKLMTQDGATIVAEDGTIIQGMTFLRPPAGTDGEIEVGAGSKHSTAARVSKLTNAICVVVSVDGRITVYSNGCIAFKMMG